MIDTFEYKITDYLNINHNNSDDVKINLNEKGIQGLE